MAHGHRPWRSPRLTTRVGRVFAILAGYRERILQTDYKYRCPLGRLRWRSILKIALHRAIARIPQGWIGAVRGCLQQAKDRLPESTDLDALATYVLAVMEGGVMIYAPPVRRTLRSGG